MGKQQLQLSALEKSWYSQVHEALGAEVPFWVLEAGGREGAGTNWWCQRLFQEVVDHFNPPQPGSRPAGAAGRVLFVQVGEPNCWNAPLKGVLDLRGQTDARQLVRLLYHAQGVVCGTREFRRLAESVEAKHGVRPCVMVSGGVRNGRVVGRAVLSAPWASESSKAIRGRRALRGALGTARPTYKELGTSREAEEVLRQMHAWFAAGGGRFLTQGEWRQAKSALQRQQTKGLTEGAAVLERVFAVVCNEAYFPGLRALLKSIALYHGTEIPVFLYYRGLAREQLEEVRRLPLELHLFEVNQLPFPSPGMWEAKQQVFAHCLGRAQCVQLLDADLVLVSAMDDVFELARAGKVVSSSDGRGVVYGSSYAAYHPELPGRAHPYLNSGALCLDVVQHWDLAGLWAFAAQYGAYTVGGGTPLGLPGHGDQGMFNAIAAQLNKTPGFHVLPEGTWCDSTQGCMLKLRRQEKDGRLVVWNVTEKAPQRLVHNTGPKWWTPEGAEYLEQFGDKLRCFQHFAAWQPARRGHVRAPRKVRILIGICSCARATARRAGIRATWLRQLPREADAVFFTGTGLAREEGDVMELAVQDHYAHLPAKVQAFFRRALDECEFDYLFKCDDDTYVCVERLLELADRGADYLGGTEWAREGYGSGGAGYLLSRRAVEVLAGARAPGCGAEDVWVGRTLREAGIRLQTTPRLRMDHREWPGPENGLVSAHWCSPAWMERIEREFKAERARPRAQQAPHTPRHQNTPTPSSGRRLLRPRTGALRGQLPSAQQKA